MYEDKFIIKSCALQLLVVVESVQTTYNGLKLLSEVTIKIS